ncbi:hypothetical protein [Endozoicomonas sp. ONNA2]|uniref:hypothetical protein n=1 Tax=Endozoicomonas sp. ONNA2 TaxID=2828741 RepID=UPI002147E1EE|nr:hypothetical protein [Endozoicomonas sp. ONNA2]
MSNETSGIGIFPGNKFNLVFTTSNREKVGSGEQAISRIFGSNYRTYKIKPEMPRLQTPTQPVGEDIEYGARSRISVVEKMWAEQNQSQSSSVQVVEPTIYVSFENGLRVDTTREGLPLSDVAAVCVKINGKEYYGESVAVPVRVDNEQVGMITEEILNFLGSRENTYDFHSRYEKLDVEQKKLFNLMVFGHEEGCDANDAVPQPQVQGLRQRVIEALLKQGVRDFWVTYSGGKLTREKGLNQAIKNALQKFINEQSGEDKLRLVQTMKQTLISLGLPASLGERYRQTVWMRDFGIEIQTLNPQDLVSPEAFNQLTNSLATIARKQDDNGLIPQVVITDQSLAEFVYYRALGGDNGLGWYHQLSDFVAENYPDITLPTLDSQSLKTIAPQELKAKLDQLYSSYQEADKRAEMDGKADDLPRPSHTLNGLLSDTLRTLTPGTTDGEIHFIRSMAKLLDLANSQEQINQVRELIPNLARAMAYLDKSVLDPNNGLPQGGDNRDMLDTWMYEKLLCSNACFLYQGLNGLARHMDEIGPELRSELSRHYPLGKTPVSGFIKALLGNNPQADVKAELAKFSQLIQETFLYDKDGRFAPRDFVDSAHRTDRKSKTAPVEYIKPLVNANKKFLAGEEVNLQGLALAIENGLVNPGDHPAAVRLISTQVTDAGLHAFSPINMADAKEIGMLQESKGFLVWPQIEYRVIATLVEHMERTPEIDALLSKLLEAGEKRKGLSEWYNLDAGKKVYGGGASGQAWSIMLMDQAMSAIKDKPIDDNHQVLPMEDDHQVLPMGDNYQVVPMEIDEAV